MNIEARWGELTDEERVSLGYCEGRGAARIGRIWIWDEERGGAYSFEAGELIHAPWMPDKHRFDWDAVAAVDLWSIEPEYRRFAEWALARLEDADEATREARSVRWMECH